MERIARREAAAHLWCALPKRLAQILYKKLIINSLYATTIDAKNDKKAFQACDLKGI
jgi:hypothetical protein